MMDVERLKKLNTLAGELKGQGIAENYEDAAYLATAIHGREPEACLSGMQMSDIHSTMADEIIENHPIEEVPIQEQQPVMSQQTIPQPIIQPGISKEEVENILQSFANQVSQEFTKLQQRVESAEATIAQLKAQSPKHSQQTTLTAAEIPAETTAAASTPSENQASKSIEPEIKDEYSPNDVSVEKMFYYGNK
jgi:hypothetical protein